ncbi:MAG TPA: acyl-CoA dehydrogenase family protein [Egibacteraceae bacterium]|nr:acyl-CoA dehydrogenase family protein [Egibacteraceae bacterium]
MHFDFTDEQYQLRDAARDFFAGESSAAHVRAMWESDTGRSPELWAKMAEMGFVGLTVPEEHGGLGMNEIDLVLLLEEAGKAALPEPLLETTAVAAPTLLEAGTPEQVKQWLPRIAAGEAVVTVQLGGAPLVADAHIADLLIVERDGALHAVPSDRFTATAQPSMDGARRVFTVEAQTDDGTRMDADAGAIAKAFDRGAWAAATFLAGIAQTELDMTVAYVKEREQFGRPVGSFQAVKHKLAETLLVVESAKAAVWYAAYAIATDAADRSQAVSVAKSYATDAEHKANYESLQCHGGIGFTWEHDLHLWLKRGKALAPAYGSARWHRERLAADLFSA